MVKLTGKQLGLLSLGVAVLLTGLLLWIRAAPNRVSASFTAAGSPSSSRSSSDLARDARDLPQAAPRIPASGQDSSVSSHGQPDSGDPEHQLSGIVLDPENKAVPGADIQVLRNVARDMNSMDPAYVQEEKTVGSAKSGPDGHFSVPIRPSCCHRLIVRATGFARSVFNACYAGEFITVRLQLSGRLIGRVTVDPGGAPVSQAQVRIWTRETPWFDLYRGETDALGDFRVEDLGNEKAYLQVIAPNAVSSPWISIDLEAGRETRRDVVLLAGVQVVGCVTDSATRSPIAGAEVSDDSFFRKSVRTGPKGEFVLTGVRADHRAAVNARASGYGRTEEAVSPDSGSPIHLDFALMRSHLALGRVLDESGIPLEDVYVAAVANDRNGSSGQRIDWVAGRSDAAGRFRMEDLRTDVRHTLLLRKERLGTAVLDFPDNEPDTAQIEFGDIVLRPGKVVQGEVIDSDDHPVPGVEVNLQGCNADRGTRSESEDFDVDTYVASRRVRTDSRGRFQFPDLAAGHYSIYAVQKGRALGSVKELIVRSDSEPDYVRLRLEAGLEIRGLAVDSDGTPIHGVVIVVQGESPEANSFAVVRNEQDGSFRVTGLEAGVYKLSGDRDVNPEQLVSGMPVRRARVVHVAAGAHDVRIVFPRSAKVGGIVSDSKGTPVTGATVAASDPDDDEMEYDMGRSGPDGHFSLFVPEGSLVRLKAQPPSATMLEPGVPRPIEDPELSRTEIVPAGTIDVSLALPR